MRFGEQPGGKIEPVRIERGGVTETYFAACRYFATEKWEFAERVARDHFARAFRSVDFSRRRGSIRLGQRTRRIRARAGVADSRRARRISN